MKSQYTQDVEFDSGFGALQTPVHLYTAGLLCGIACAPVDRPFRFLDLACGNGLTLSLVADAYPFAEFVGVDINPAHIERAQGRAAAANLGNIEFVQADIADLDPTEFQAFDYCAISGVYSWLDAVRMRKAREFINRVVKPGGLVYLDYSTQPGMAQTAPLYQILRQVGAACVGDSAERLTSATQLLDGMRQQGAQFFKQNPNAGERLRGIIQNPAESEAHEIFNLQNSGLWSAEVIESMQQQGFSYIGSSALHHNIAAFSSHVTLPEQCKALPLSLQQTLHDVNLNVSQRKDLYVREQPAGEVDLQDELSRHFVYSAPGALSPANLERVNKGYPGVDFSRGALASAIASARSATQFGDLFSGLGDAGFAAEDAHNAVSILLASRLISIAIKPPLAQTSPDAPVMLSALNRLILAQDIAYETSRPFVSPVVGSRVLMPIRDRLYLWALVRGDIGSAWDEMGELQAAFRGQQGEALDREGFIQVIEASLDRFRNVAVPELVRLGILGAGD